MPECRYFLVSGRVQGVFFRASTQETADALALTGWVRNTADGRVELVACGDTQPLQQLETWLRQGPTHARVDDLQIKPVAPQAYDRFEIRY